MNQRLISVTAGITVCTLLLAPFARPAEKKETNWPSFRGVNASGVADGFLTPTTWDVEKKQNILWKTPVAGLGHSSPVIWGDLVFVTTGVSGKKEAGLKVGLYGDIEPVKDDTVHEWKVYCVNKKTGKIVWEKVSMQGVPKIKRHTKATQANPSVATDGKNVVAFFGSEGMYCYDMAGKLLWKRDLGTLDSGYFAVPDAQWGFASSPIIHKNRVLIQCDIQKGSFVAALDLKTGKDVWRTPRSDVPTWSTPAVSMLSPRPQVVVNGWKHIGGYDLETGKETWRLTGGGDIPVPTPLVGKDFIFITNAHGRLSPVYAIRPTATGDITLSGDERTNKHIAWSVPRGGAYMQTPLIYGDYLYNCRDNGVLTCYEAKTGKQVYQERLGTGRTGFTASAVAGDGKLYFTSEEGDIFVVKAGPTFQVLGTNPMGEVCMATPALSEGVLFFRTQGHLVAVSEKPMK